MPLMNLGRLKSGYSIRGVRICLSNVQQFQRYSKISFKFKKNRKVNNSFWTIPNIITISRITSTPLIGYCMMTNKLVPGFCLFAYSCVSDFIDGYVARKYNIKSVVGTILDPMADKLLILVMTCSLSFPPGPQLIPIAIAGLIIGRDILLAVFSGYYRYSSMLHCYSRVTWKSYWNFISYPSAEVKPTMISKCNTMLQMIYLGWAIVLMTMNSGKYSEKNKIEKDSSRSWWDVAFRNLGYLVGATTVASGGSYIVNKNTVKYLKNFK